MDGRRSRVSYGYMSGEGPETVRVAWRDVYQRGELPSSYQCSLQQPFVDEWARNGARGGSEDSRVIRRRWLRWWASHTSLTPLKPIPAPGAHMPVHRQPPVSIRRRISWFVRGRMTSPSETGNGIQRRQAARLLVVLSVELPQALIASDPPSTSPVWLLLLVTLSSVDSSRIVVEFISFHLSVCSSVISADELYSATLYGVLAMKPLVVIVLDVKYVCHVAVSPRATSSAIEDAIIYFWPSE